ncbi:hypothetical protein IDJ77_15975 [Mucilaginibacter sp. ZT4R22]|uniref:YCII-related domain-containing protein n=1 Tax=Mucilaginibacter pankratovii TaxID=2772110 RepID=A0ABR7WSN4_9SPHI|nr:YciI family protein [Mucilaginibacter pankratovii]MBD1365315.1 hypothetical protein [Mucilaginibacter pankratovii]
MKEYLLLFRNSAGDEGYLSTTQDMATDMPLWQAWIGGIAMQGKLVSTAPVEFAGSLVFKYGGENTAHKEADNVMVSGYLICKADSLAEVQEWSKSCPILKYPNSSVEIRPLVPFPIN